ncbi:MAG: hypothetical protein K0S33_2731 [Bacteroidetes bacterium]|jgi:hypothetical protein|nr:hypothetical protein [Bacteroidota bacterium]
MATKKKTAPAAKAGKKKTKPAAKPTRRKAVKPAAKKTAKAKLPAKKKAVKAAPKKITKTVKKKTVKPIARKTTAPIVKKKSPKPVPTKVITKKVTKPAPSAHGLSPTDITRLAIQQHKGVLMANFKNILSLSDTLHNGKHIVAIYIKDSNKTRLPLELEVMLPDGSSIKVKTEIVTGMGEAIPHIGQATDELSDSVSSNYMGTICCLVSPRDNPEFVGVVTSGHIFTHGKCIDYGGILSEEQKRNVLINFEPKATLLFQQMQFNQDLAIAELTNKSNLLKNYISFSKGQYIISDDDLHSPEPNVTIVSRRNNKRDAYILDYNVSFEISYTNISKELSNIILIGTNNDRQKSKGISVGGDSGSAVYHKKTGKLIGMLLGGNDKFSFVLPVHPTLDSFNFNIL